MEFSKFAGILSAAIWLFGSQQTVEHSSRDKKGFLSYQCKEIEKNNRIGKTRDLFKKIRNTTGTFHAKIGSIKDRNIWT